MKSTFGFFVVVLSVILVVVVNATGLRASQQTPSMHLSALKAKKWQGLEIDTEEIDLEAVEQSKGKFFEWSIFNFLDYRENSDEISHEDCLQNIGETRFTYTMGYCLPEAGYAGYTKAWVSRNGAVRVWEFPDATCAPGTETYKFFFKPEDINVGCSPHGVTVKVVDKRTPHTMGVVKKAYGQKNCEGPFTAILFPDNYCFTEEIAPYYAVGNCMTNEATIYMESTNYCEPIQATGSQPLQSLFNGYGSCIEIVPSRYEIARCGGQLPLP